MALAGDSGQAGSPRQLGQGENLKIGGFNHDRIAYFDVGVESGLGDSDG